MAFPPYLKTRRGCSVKAMNLGFFGHQRAGGKQWEASRIFDHSCSMRGGQKYGAYFLADCYKKLLAILETRQLDAIGYANVRKLQLFVKSI